jgi:hypothetical protein
MMIKGDNETKIVRYSLTFVCEYESISLFEGIAEGERLD